jgi:hypothetical protein
LKEMKGMKIQTRLGVATAIAAGLAVVVALLVIPAFASPGVTMNTFKNLNKQDAKDLHIQYNTVITAPPVQNPPNTFGSTTGAGRSNMIDLSNGTVAGNGGQLQLTAIGQADPTKVVQWWWTNAHGDVLGHKHSHCAPPDCTSP